MRSFKAETSFKPELINLFKNAVSVGLTQYYAVY